MFSVEPDMHIDSLEQAEAIVLEGTSKWSCKIEITGQRSAGYCIGFIHSQLRLWSRANIRYIKFQSEQITQTHRYS